MTLYEFNDLCELEQYQVLQSYGIRLMHRTDHAYLYTLYALDCMYVETKMHILKDVLHTIKAFKMSTLLDPYLDSIDISNITLSS